MTLVLSDQEIASRDCENGALGAFQTTRLFRVLCREALGNVDERM